MIVSPSLSEVCICTADVVFPFSLFDRHLWSEALMRGQPICAGRFSPSLYWRLTTTDKTSQLSNLTQFIIIHLYIFIYFFFKGNSRYVHKQCHQLGSCFDVRYSFDIRGVCTYLVCFLTVLSSSHTGPSRIPPSVIAQILFSRFGETVWVCSLSASSTRLYSRDGFLGPC